MLAYQTITLILKYLHLSFCGRMSKYILSYSLLCGHFMDTIKEFKGVKRWELSQKKLDWL